MVPAVGDPSKGRVFALAAALTISAAGLVSIQTHEGVIKRAYIDPVGVVTVCAGHTLTAKLGQVKTDQQCTDLLQQDTKFAEAGVKRVVKVPITQGQYDALVGLAFNVGVGNLARSTLVRKLNAGECLAAADQFLRWNRAGGQVLKGLTKRRVEERAKFIQGCL
jgi:lysozyme